MANVEFMKGVETGVSVHGELFAVLKELQPNNLIGSINENESRTNPSNFRVSEDTEHVNDLENKIKMNAVIFFTSVPSYLVA